MRTMGQVLQELDETAQQMKTAGDRLLVLTADLKNTELNHSIVSLLSCFLKATSLLPEMVQIVGARAEEKHEHPSSEEKA